MPADNVHHRKGKKRYSVVLVPGDEAGKSHSFSVNWFGAIALMVGVLILIVVVGAVAILYTPVGNLIPIPAPKLEQTYGRQIAQIQSEVNKLLQEMSVLRSYNVRLRKALGDRMAPADSAVASGTAGSSVAQNPPSSSESASPASTAVMDSVVGSTPEVSLPSPLAIVSADTEREKVEREFLPLTMPADGFLTRGFDAVHDHYGIDIAGKRGSGILAAADGSVLFAGWTYEDGFTIMISHAQGYVTVYKHNDELLKSSGANVRRGEVIALLGNTGKTSSGPHLHFEVWKNGSVYNPANYLLMTQ